MTQICFEVENGESVGLLLSWRSLAAVLEN